MLTLTALRSPADVSARGHDVIMTPCNSRYLDYGQGLSEDMDPFQYNGGCVTLAQCHAIDPCEGVPEKLRMHIVGGRDDNCSEYTWNQYDLEWKMRTRGCALAEAFWCGVRKSSFGDLLPRMTVHRRRLIEQGVNCAPL